jgi:hypothetical protein
MMNDCRHIRQRYYIQNACAITFLTPYVRGMGILQVLQVRMSTSNSDNSSSSSDDDVRRVARERLREACDPDWAAGIVRPPPAPKRARHDGNDDLCVTDAFRDHVSQRLQQKLDG